MMTVTQIATNYTYVMYASPEEEEMRRKEKKKRACDSLTRPPLSTFSALFLLLLEWSMPCATLHGTAMFAVLNTCMAPRNVTR